MGMVASSRAKLLDLYKRGRRANDRLSVFTMARAVPRAKTDLDFAGICLLISL
jgi:hypothetical protein|tara:strand:- start:11225 stop:11383 length:159 start_codon:yes stop_codon:yes gene_type:complete